jgi:hypothetical protein
MKEIYRPAVTLCYYTNIWMGHNKRQYIKEIKKGPSINICDNIMCLSPRINDRFAAEHQATDIIIKNRNLCLVFSSLILRTQAQL